MFVEDDRSGEEQQYNPEHNLFYTAPVQLIVETSNQTDSLSWRNIFITEKSYKTFAWYQFPIWYAVPGSVDKIREQGFDVFDDIIDHSYDMDTDPNTRMDKVVAEAHRFSNKDTVALRQTHWQRLQNNAQLVDYISKTAFTVQKQKAQKLQDELHQLYKSKTSISA